MANARIDDRGRSSAGDYSMMASAEGARMGTESGDMTGTAGVQSAGGDSGMMGNMGKMNMFGMVEAGAKGLTNQENAQYTDGAQGGTNGNLEKQAGKILPWMGMATSLRDMGQSYLGRDELGNLKGDGNKIAGEWSTADHTQMLKYAQKGDAWGVVRESAGIGKIGRTVSHIAGKGKEESGGWGKFNKAMGMEKDKVAVDPNLAIKQQAEMADIANKNKYGTFRQGGMSYPTNAIPMHGNMWAVPTFAMGGVNAEVEKQENTIAPDGEFTQFDGPSHEQGGIKTSLEPGELIFSDKLKPMGSKKTFAKLNKSNNTNKEQKILEDPKSSTLSKKTAELNLMSKQADSLKLFQAQESLKMSKLNSYTKRLGGIQTHAYGGYQDDPVKKIGASGYNAVLIDPKNLPSDYQFQERTTTPLGGGRTRVTNVYNKPVTDKPVPSTSPGGPSADWENAIIKRLQSGESPEDLRVAGYFGNEGAKKYAKYYRPLKTEITQEAPKQDARVYGEKTIAGKIQPKGYAEQPWETYRTFPEAGKANVYTDVNYYQGKPIDVTKSFDSTGKFIPSYLDSAATGTYLQQQGNTMNRNPLPLLNPNEKATNLNSYSVNRYGGIQKFSPGGTYPNKSLYDFNMPIGGPLDQAILRDKNQSYKSDKTEYNYDPTTGKYYHDPIIGTPDTAGADNTPKSNSRSNKN